MARITIVGQAIVVTSSLALEDIKTVAKYRPEALTLYGGEDDKEPVFKLGVTSGTGAIGKYGAEFGTETRDEEKLAVMTLILDSEAGEDPKEYVADKLGGALMNLNALEEKLPSVIEEIAAERTKILEAITVTQ